MNANILLIKPQVFLSTQKTDTCDITPTDIQVTHEFVWHYGCGLHID